MNPSDSLSAKLEAIASQLTAPSPELDRKAFKAPEEKQVYCPECGKAAERCRCRG